MNLAASKELTEAITMCDELIAPRLDEMDVQPPTEQSLRVASEVGIILGTRLYETKVASQDRIHVRQHVRDLFGRKDIHDQNMWHVLNAALEAQIASGFEHVKTSLQAPNV